MNQKLKKSSYKAPPIFKIGGNSFLFAFSKENAKIPKIGQFVVKSFVPQSILLRTVFWTVPMKAGCYGRDFALPSQPAMR
jgi:hypothetical protein